MPTSIIQTFQETWIFLLSLLPLLLSLFLVYRWISLTFIPGKNIPPSPPKLPIIGNLHQLGSFPFRSLQALSEKYGDLMLLHLGSKPTLVVSSAEMASEVLKTHDLIFAGRPNLSVFRRLLGNGRNMISAPYGEYWRQMRSICMLELLSNKRVWSYRRVREEEVATMMKDIQGRQLTVVNLSDMFMSFNNDLICRVAFGRKYRGGNGDIDFTKTLDVLIKLLGGFYIGDFIGWLAWTNRVVGVDAKVNKVALTLDRFLGGILQDHSDRAAERSGDGEENVKDFVDVLLEEAQGDNTSRYPLLNRDSLKCLIQDIFAAATETTALVSEWAMSELLRNPRVMRELKKEVSRVTTGNSIVSEDVLENMSYLKAVLKETLRLHPPAPLLIPHECTKDMKIKGYDISAGTQVYVNAWAISRDPKYWEEPESFYPERFLDSAIDFKGRDFQFIPFGSGRRICPGMTFAMVNMELVIANLVHHFDWSLPDGIASEALDMTESPGITIHRKNPLKAIASPRVI